MPSLGRRVPDPGAWSRSSDPAHGRYGAAVAEQGSMASRAGPPLGQCGGVKSRVALEPFAATPALARTKTLRFVFDPHVFGSHW
jgi:hypothetical protein